MLDLLNKVRRRIGYSGKATVHSDYGAITLYLERPESEEELRRLAAQALKDIHHCRLYGSARETALYPECFVRMLPGSQAQDAKESARPQKDRTLTSGSRLRAASRRSFQEFLKGIGTALEIMPAESPKPFPGLPLKDEDAIYSDWCRIGRDLLTAAAKCHDEAKSNARRR